MTQYTSTAPSSDLWDIRDLPPALAQAVHAVRRRPRRSAPRHVSALSDHEGERLFTNAIPSPRPVMSEMT